MNIELCQYVRMLHLSLFLSLMYMIHSTFTRIISGNKFLFVLT